MTQNLHLVIDYTNMGTIYTPKLTSQDHHQAQTPGDWMTGLLHVKHHGQGHHTQGDGPL